MGRCRPTMTPQTLPRLLTSICSSLIASLLVTSAAHADETRVIFNPKNTSPPAQIAANDGADGQVSWQVTPEGLEVTVPAGATAGFPGIKITPATPWDASAGSRLVAAVTNTGPARIAVHVKLENDGPWQENRWNASRMGIAPGETREIPVHFGASYDKSAYALDAKALIRAVIFVEKSASEQRFRLDALKSGGVPGEAIPLPTPDPEKVAVKISKILPGETPLDPKRQLIGAGGATAGLEDEGRAIRIDFTEKPGQSVTIRPLRGRWNLNEHLQVRLTVRNAGTSPIRPTVRLESVGGPSNEITPEEPIPAGGEAEIIVPFIQAKPWVGISSPEQQVFGPTNGWKNRSDSDPGTGTKYTSNTTTGIKILGNEPGSLLITSIVADMPPREPLPDWLGRRPPVEGDWKLTFDENFDRDSLDLTRWSIHANNYWNPKLHFSRRNVLLQDGKLILRLEKRRGRHNDKPDMGNKTHFVSDGMETEYVTGFAYTYGKWVQRYGYFEARLKYPLAPNMFSAFWLMPDRGRDAGEEWVRTSTEKGGMEFDIFENLSIWGPNRYDIAMHWDGYKANNKSLFYHGNYVYPDEDGFITVGLLWLPGQAIYYANGRETARWESPRVSHIQSHILLDLIMGGWETEPLDDAQLPADFIIDYIRVWQRSDLASELDGPLPNNGTEED